MGKASRDKGKRGEREVANLLCDATGVAWKRGLQSRGGGQEVPDVYTRVYPWDRLHIEVKRNERLNVWAAMDQARSDAREGAIPVVIARRNRGGWIVVMDLGPWLSVLLDWANWLQVSRLGGEE